MNKLCLWLFFLFVGLSSFSQNESTHFYSMFGQYGWVMPTNDFVRGENTDNKTISQVYALSLRYAVQTAGEKYWHQMYDYPSYGFGIYTADFNVKNQLGRPVALYAFITKPIFSKGKYNLTGDYALGMAFNWTHFTYSHPERVVMGGYASCYIDATFTLNRTLSQNLALGLGVSLSHFSNGAIRKPNKGLNLISSKLSVNYYPKPLKQHKTTPLPHFDKRTDDLWSVFIGSHNVLTTLSAQFEDEPYDRRSYFVFGIDRRVLRRFNLKHSLGFGLGLGYNQYVGTSYKIIDRELRFYGISHAERFNFSAYISYEYSIHRLGIVLEPGIYLYKNKLDESKRLFQRIGLRYNFANGFFAGLNLRAANFSVAQYIEWTIGFATRNS